MRTNRTTVIVDQVHSDSIDGDSDNEYTLKIAEEGKYSISVKNTQSDLDL